MTVPTLSEIDDALRLTAHLSSEGWARLAPGDVARLCAAGVYHHYELSRHLTGQRVDDYRETTQLRIEVWYRRRADAPPLPDVHPDDLLRGTS